MDERDRYIFDFMKRIEEIRKSSGFDILQKIRIFRTSFSVYSENYRVLTKTLKQYYSNERILLENSVTRWRKQRIVVKDIHNVISSAKSYVDHISKMDSSETVRQKIKAEFERNPLYHFIRALRNFLLHKEPLSLVSRIEHSRLKTGQIKSLQYESMNKASFTNYLTQRTSNGQNTHDTMAIQYLQQLPDKINLNTVMREFNDLLCSFHNWFILIYVTENNADLQNLCSEIKELHQDAATNGLTQDYPITKGQLRHLNILLKKSDKLKGKLK